MNRSIAPSHRPVSRPRRRLAIYATALVGAFLAACSSTGKETIVAGKKVGYWLPASPILHQQIQDEADRLPWRHGVERLEAIRWFASVGEPAYPMLLTLATDPRDQVVASALAALGATGDSRLAEPLRIIPWEEGRFRGDLGLELARTLVRLGDWDEMPVLIAGLRDSRLFTRSLCSKSLSEATGDSRGYDPRAPEVERERAVLRWEAWWLARTGEGLLESLER
jgi:hypothetical protein